MSTEQSGLVEVLARTLAHVRERMAGAAGRVGRSAAEIRLVAVTKKCPASWAADLGGLGQLDLGENYPQELWKKVEALSGEAGLRWHLIGHLQSNKATRTLPLVKMVHAVDSLALLGKLDQIARGLDHPPSACLQVNISEEDSKHGWSVEGILADAEAIARVESLPVVGLMTIAGYGTTAEEARPAFARLRSLRDDLEARIGRALPELSMGMSTDFESAIEEGATLVRVGSALFEGMVEP
jgi:pyridoxal phosphate enzyme (YggS family)